MSNPVRLIWIPDVHLDAGQPIPGSVDNQGNPIPGKDTQPQSQQPNTWAQQTTWIRDKVQKWYIHGVLAAGDFNIYISPNNYNLCQLDLPTGLAWAWGGPNEPNYNVPPCLQNAGWSIIDSAVLPDNSPVPYLTAIGNHDYGSSSSPGRGDSTIFLNYFGETQLKDKAWYVGNAANAAPPADGTNQAITIDAEGRHILVIALEFFPSKEALDWAGNLISKYRLYEVIIITHGYMKLTATNTDTMGTSDPTADLNNFFGTYDTYGPNYYGFGTDDFTDGNDLFEWAKGFSNVCAILCGHDIPDPSTIGQGSNFTYRVDPATDGHPLVSIFANWQLGARDGTTPTTDPNWDVVFYDQNKCSSRVVLLLELSGTELTINAYNTSGDPPNPYNVSFPVVLPWHSGLVNPIFYFQVSKGSFGHDEVSLNSDFPITPQSCPMWLVIDGVTLTQAQQLNPTVTSSEPSILVQPDVNQAESDTAGMRILIPCSINFTDLNIFPQSGSTFVDLTSEITQQGQVVTAFTEIELVQGDAPYFSNYDAAGDNPFWLSQDLRVFTLTPGAPNGNDSIQISTNNTNMNLPLNVTVTNQDYSQQDSTAAFSFIQNLLQQLDDYCNDPDNGDPFANFPVLTDPQTGDSLVAPWTQQNGKYYANYNFAVARVRIGGRQNKGKTAANVRVFFRLFCSMTNDTDYQTYTYPFSKFDSCQQPLQPSLGTDEVTIPFFATGNYQTNLDYIVNQDYVDEKGNEVQSINNQPIDVESDSGAWAFYGCFLNIYGPENTVNCHDNIVRPVSALLPSTHACLVAQLVYDPMPLDPSQILGPEYSTQFAQRNLQVTPSENPGPASSHRVPLTFDLRPSPELGKGPLMDHPDELMIDWGEVPIGSTAKIYWPTVKADDVLKLANRLYFNHRLSIADPYTVQCEVQHGFTFIPIPPGEVKKFAGLFTIDLPVGVKAGETFKILVRRISSHQAPPPPPPQSQPKIAVKVPHQKATACKIKYWRYIVGTFAIHTPVATAKEILPQEENTLAIMKWRLGQMSANNRWVPVLKRYIGIIEDRIRGMHGDPDKIKPSPWGVVEEPSREQKRVQSFTGKVDGIVYDHFGDFEAFVLETLEGEHRRFVSHEPNVLKLVHRAWAHRILTTVMVRHHRPERPIEIILHGAPPLFEE